MTSRLRPTRFHEQLLPEIQMSTSRSGGPGGQHVNKVSSKVTLRFDVRSSRLLEPVQKEILLARLRSHITQDGVLMLSAQKSRSQLQNKQDALRKFDQLIQRAFARRKPRRPTKPSGAAKRKRVEEKKKRGERKAMRRRIRGAE